MSENEVRHPWMQNTSPIGMPGPKDVALEDKLHHPRPIDADIDEIEQERIAPILRMLTDKLGKLGMPLPTDLIESRSLVMAMLAVLHQAYQQGVDAAWQEAGTTDQVAEALEVPRAAVTRLARQHDIGRKLGRDRLFLPADFAALRDALERSRPDQESAAAPRQHAVAIQRPS